MLYDTRFESGLKGNVLLRDVLHIFGTSRKPLVPSTLTIGSATSHRAIFCLTARLPVLLLSCFHFLVLCSGRLRLTDVVSSLPPFGEDGGREGLQDVPEAVLQGTVPRPELRKLRSGGHAQGKAEELCA